MKTEKEKQLEIDLLTEKIERISKKKVVFLEKTDKRKKISFKESLKRNIIKESEEKEVEELIINVEFTINKNASKEGYEDSTIADVLNEKLCLTIYEENQEAMDWLNKYVFNVS